MIALSHRERQLLHHLFGQGLAGIQEADQALTSSDSDIPTRIFAKVYLTTERPPETGLAHDDPMPVCGAAGAVAVLTAAATGFLVGAVATVAVAAGR